MEKAPSFAHRFWGHLSTITRHKVLVGRLCFRLGLYRQGLAHDWSKYSPAEFWAGVRYYQGSRSPIEKEKEVKGFSEGWLHHKGRNRHHWEYWIDVKNSEIIVLPIPKNVLKEMAADRIAACMIYQGKSYDDSHPLLYFENGRDRKLMNPESAEKLEAYLRWVKDYGLEEGLKRIRND